MNTDLLMIMTYDNQGDNYFNWYILDHMNHILIC